MKASLQANANIIDSGCYLAYEVDEYQAQCLMPELTYYCRILSWKVFGRKYQECPVASWLYQEALGLLGTT
jgi:hypothetical protein